LLIVVCAPAIAVTAGVFIATTAARGRRTAAAAAMPAAVALPTRCLPSPPLPRCRRAAAAGKLPLPLEIFICTQVRPSTWKIYLRAGKFICGAGKSIFVSTWNIFG
jgi:hypothetical protein